MTGLDAAWAIEEGGYDARYAVVRAIAVEGDIAAVIIDSNGDGADINLEQYSREPGGEWQAGNSGGGAGDAGSSWSPEMVAEFGRSDPFRVVHLRYDGKGHTVTVRADEHGWWLFITPPTGDEGEFATVRAAGSPPG